MAFYVLNEEGYGAGTGTGPAGPTGPQGVPGVDGKTVRNGSGAPASSLGNDGDFYIDTTAKTLYGPKTSGAWGSATSIIGPSGAVGAAGSPGATGATGSQGPQGVAGAAGADGKTILNGTGIGAPGNAVGKDGDFFLNTSTYVLYGPKNAGAWPATGTSLIGPQGPAGPSGSAGSTFSDITVNSTGSTNLTISNQGSTSNIPTLIYNGTFSAASNVHILSQTFWNTLNTANGALSGEYKFSASAANATAPVIWSLDATTGGYNLLSFNDTSKLFKVTGTYAAANGTTGASGLTAYGYIASPNSGTNWNPARTAVSMYIGGNEIGYWNASGYTAVVGGSGGGGGSSGTLTVTPYATGSNNQLTAAQSGQVITIPSNGSAVLPTAAVGLTYTLVNVGTVGSCRFLAQAGDTITHNNTVTASGGFYYLQMNSAAATITCLAANKWYITSTTQPTAKPVVIGGNVTATPDQNGMIFTMNQGGTLTLPPWFIGGEFTVCNGAANNALALQSVNSDIIYWGGGTGAGFPTTKASGQNFLHLNAAIGARIRVIGSNTAQWGIAEMVGTSWG